MAIYRGLVRSVQVRSDGWVELVVMAVHASNATQTFFIDDLDGPIEDANKRLGRLGLLRDALSRVLPVEIEYHSDGERGDMVDDVTVFARPSLEGRQGSSRLEGVVIGISLTERNPSSATSPYLDPADLAAISLLADDGSVQVAYLDLQRPDPLTAQSMLALLGAAHDNRRRVALLVTLVWNDKGSETGYGGRNAGQAPGFIEACEWITVPEADLEYHHAFIERLGQRYESYERSAASELSFVRVLYTTAPDQTPEGDISENGSFTPVTAEAWVHGDSPLYALLQAALRDGLQVQLGLREGRVESVQLVGPLGSAARPIWIEVCTKVTQLEESGLCDNVPTIRSPSGSDFDRVPVDYTWCGQAFFNEGIWRVVALSANEVDLTIDGKTPCASCGPEVKEAEQTAHHAEPKPSMRFASPSKAYAAAYERDGEVPRTKRAQVWHAYLKGMHTLRMRLTDRSCSQPLSFAAYRVR
jgi:hypothetical protein